LSFLFAIFFADFQISFPIFIIAQALIPNHFSVGEVVELLKTDSFERFQNKLIFSYDSWAYFEIFSKSDFIL